MQGVPHFSRLLRKVGIAAAVTSECPSLNPDRLHRAIHAAWKSGALALRHSFRKITRLQPRKTIVFAFLGASARRAFGSTRSMSRVEGSLLTLRSNKRIISGY
jgi:hypothetical protein